MRSQGDAYRFVCISCGAPFGTYEIDLERATTKDPGGFWIDFPGPRTGRQNYRVVMGREDQLAVAFECGGGLHQTCHRSRVLDERGFLRAVQHAVNGEVRV